MEKKLEEALEPTSEKQKNTTIDDGCKEIFICLMEEINAS